MITPSLRCLTVLAVLLFAGAGARAELPIIAKARAFVGPDAALDAIKSIHYVGSLITSDPTDARKLTYVTVDIMIQSPYRQRISNSSDKSIEVTALDSYDGWHRVQDPKDPARWKLMLLGKDQIKLLRANTWENLAFYRGLEREGGTVIDRGAATVDGVACRKIAFVHDDKIAFIRYFDEATGRLVLTEVGYGVAIRELGEIRVNGVRFPKTIITTATGADGKPQSVTVTFDKVTVNESFPDGTFAVPAFSGK